MNMTDFVTAVIAQGVPGLDKMPEKRAAKLVAATLRTLGAQIDSAAEGETIRIPAVGFFTARNVTTKDGNVLRRVQFRRAVPKPREVVSEAN